MPRSRLGIPLVLTPIAFTAGGISCTVRDVKQKSFQELCTQWCLKIPECYADQYGEDFAGDYDEYCPIYCEDVERYATEYGDRCVEAYRDLLDCFVGLSCRQIMQGPDACEQLFDPLDEHCGGGGGSSDPGEGGLGTSGPWGTETSGAGDAETTFTGGDATGTGTTGDTTGSSTGVADTTTGPGSTGTGTSTGG